MRSCMLPLFVHAAPYRAAFGAASFYGILYDAARINHRDAAITAQSFAAYRHSLP